MDSLIVKQLWIIATKACDLFWLSVFFYARSLRTELTNLFNSLYTHINPTPFLSNFILKEEKLFERNNPPESDMDID